MSNRVQLTMAKSWRGVLSVAAIARVLREVALVEGWDGPHGQIESTPDGGWVTIPVDGVVCPMPSTAFIAAVRRGPAAVVRLPGVTNG